MHLHGHDFAIVNFSTTLPRPGEEIIYNTHNPPRRDVVLIPVGDFAVIAFRADNPGAWLMHCHIARHAAEGLGLQILELVKKANEIWPKGDSNALTAANRVCDNWKLWQGNCSNWAVPCTHVFQDDSGV